MGVQRSPFLPSGVRCDGRRLRAGLLAFALSLPLSGHVHAQAPNVPQVLRGGQGPAGTPIGLSTAAGGGNMVVNANQMVYDDRRQTVIARGRVQIFYDGRTIEADEVVYDRGRNRVRALGNVRLTERNGNIAYAQEMDFDQEFKNGFVRSLNIETPDRRRIGALQTRRESGETTTLEGTTYTACEPCRDDASRPPTWRVRSKRVIHKESERTIYFEESRLELWGVPIAYIPYFWAPDGTERKKSGFLLPSVMSSSRVGVGVEIPYFWNMAPNYDLLLQPVIYSRQGVMPRFEYRHGFETGALSVRGAVINQLDRNAFPSAPSNQPWRGFFQSAGEFRLTERWRVGWNFTLMSDPSFLRDYGLLVPNQFEANSRLYLRGEGDRSWFDLSTTRYIGVTQFDTSQQIQPITHPQLDYFKVFDTSVLGGEFSWRANVLSMTRERAQISPRPFGGVLNASGAVCTTDPAVYTNPPPGQRVNNRADCILNGFDGTYSRASIEGSWRRRIVDQVGQVWEPYFALRGDIAAAHVRDNSPVLGTFIRLTNSESIVRVMPTAALTYRYPFVGVSTMGTTTVEPIAQLIVRPDETQIGRLPNEDAQSLVFDDTNLFSYSRFSGWDRIEGGGRLNYGLSVSHTFTNGSRLNVMFGQSVHLFGLNSFTFGDPGRTTGVYDASSVGANSGLDKPRSDYVGRITYQLNNSFRISARGRFDERTFALQRGEVETVGRFGPVGLSSTLTFVEKQPLLGFPVARAGFTTAMSYQVTDNWSVFGAVRYSFQRTNPDISDPSRPAQRNMLDGFTVGINYLDECFQFGVFYARDVATAILGSSAPVGSRDIHRFMFRFNIRTLGDAMLTQNVSNYPLFQ